MLISYFLPGDSSTLWDCQANSIDHDSIFCAVFFKEKAIHISPIYNYQRGKRESWFVCELIFLWKFDGVYRR